MLEICFGDSVKGALTVAQHSGRSVIGSGVAFITEKKGLSGWLQRRRAKQAYLQRQEALDRLAVPLGGTHEDIAALSFGFSQGDIAAPLAEDCPKREELRQTVAFDDIGRPRDVEQTVASCWDGWLRDLDKVQNGPEEVRLWVDDTPDSRCGLLFVADLLQEKKTALHVVELPGQIVRADGVTVSYRGWGEVEPQLFGTFLDRQRVLSKEEVCDLAAQWQTLQAENAPLRVVENGTVYSAGIDYYDDAIRREFPQDTGTVGRLIANALVRQNLRISDVFIARRIQHFIAQGELTVVGTSQRGFYGTPIQCSK